MANLTGEKEYVFYVLVNEDGEFLDWHGYTSEDIENASIFTTEEQALSEKEKLDEPEEFEVRKGKVEYWLYD